MANKFCSKCGKELAAGRRFCGGCGQPVAVPAIQTPPESALAFKAATSICAKCGTALPPGKRFCKQCGHPVGEPVPPDMQAPAAASSVLAKGPTVQACKQCGSALVPGKRFCKSCGHATDAPPAESVPAPGGTSLPAKDEPAPIPANLIAAVEPDLALHPQDEPASVWPSSWEPVEQKSPFPPVPAAIFSSSISPSVPRRFSMQQIGIAIGVAAALLVAVGGWAVYAHSHRSVSSVATVPSTLQPASTPAEQPSKSYPGIPGPAASATRQSQPRPATVPPSAPVPSKVTQDSGRQLAKITPPPQMETPPPSLPQPAAAPHSGTLHYQGPPVPYNGTVVFDHLPLARLKFNFDRQAWTMTIKPNPDGTKRVSMISQKAGYQANCDLSWEVVQ